MDGAKDQEFYQTYLQKLEDDDDGGLVENCELIQTACSDMEQEVGKNNKNGSIIMDGQGNYYYQSSEKTLKDEPLKKVSEVPVKTIVVPENNRKNTAQTSSVPTKKIKLETSTSKKSKTKKNNAKEANETITSEIGNQKEVYEFDENEQDPDDPQDVTQADYGSKGVIKNITKTAAKEAASYTCMICSYETNKKFLLSRHLKTHSDDRPHKCSVCERGFKTKASLINHRNTHLGYKPYSCSSCDMAFTTSGELVRHVRYRHTHIKPHKCTECDYCSVEMSKLRRHMRCHTGERPYQCPHCTYASPDTFKLKRHMRTHTGEKPYECDICHARFTQSNSLKHHRLIHSVNEKPVFQCHLCPTTCGRKTDLRLHIKKLHNSDQPIPCKRCGKELPDRYSYKMHVKTHEGEKCYRCDYCPYASISQRHLDSHIAIHLDTKPFVCEMCQKSFRQKALLARHMKMYHADNYTPPPTRKKDHKCPHCNKMFAFNGNLIRHMEIHDPTSRLVEEKEILKMGRMKRVQPDGTIVMVYSTNNLSNKFDGNYEESSEENEIQQDEDEELQEEDEEYEVPEEYNDDNIQYVYEELEADEYEVQVGDEQYENQQEAFDQKASYVKNEKMQIDIAQSVKAEDSEDSEIMSLKLQDDQGFMIIEVLPDDDEDKREQQQSPDETKPKIINKRANESTVIQARKKTQPLISDYFGFEVDEDEDDEETKGAIKLLEIIEQE